MSPFNVAKYSIYTLVMINLLYYAILDLRALKLLPPDAGIGEAVRGFGSTIDYVAWMILIALFEIETVVIRPRGFSGIARRAAYAVGLVCYAALVYAAYTYIADYQWYDRFETHSPENLYPHSTALADRHNRAAYGATARILLTKTKRGAVSHFDRKCFGKPG